MRNYQKYSYKQANFRICSTRIDLIIRGIKKQRNLLEAYIKRHPEFASALSPLDLLPGAPYIAKRMHSASVLTGVGPMAAVAGAAAQRAAEAALAARAVEAIVENGGDIFLCSRKTIVVGLYAGNNDLSDKLAFEVQPGEMPLAVCSSSSRMGHSLSFGNCDLATVVSADGALADAAATLACNLVHKPEDIPETLDRVSSIRGILGLVIVKGEKIGLAGDLPRLIRNKDIVFQDRISRTQADTG